MSWKCKNCKEDVDDNLAICWSCQYDKKGKPTIEPSNDLNVKYSVDEPTNDNYVVVTDIKMSFFSMVIFMVKWAIASIPALIILFLIGMVLSAFGVGIATIFK